MRNVTEDTFELEVQRFKEERRRNTKQEDSEVQEVISRVRSSRPPGASAADSDDDNGKYFDEVASLGLEAKLALCDLILVWNCALAASEP